MISAFLDFCSEARSMVVFCIHLCLSLSRCATHGQKHFLGEAMRVQNHIPNCNQCYHDHVEVKPLLVFSQWILSKESSAWAGRIQRRQRRRSPWTESRGTFTRPCSHP